MASATNSTSSEESQTPGLLSSERVRPGGYRQMRTALFHLFKSLKAAFRSPLCRRLILCNLSALLLMGGVVLHTSLQQTARLAQQLRPLEIAAQILAQDLVGSETLQQARARLVHQAKGMPQLDLFLLGAEGQIIARTDAVDTRLYHPFSVLRVLFPVSGHFAFLSDPPTGHSLAEIVRHVSRQDSDGAGHTSTVWIAECELLLVAQAHMVFPAHQAATLVVLYRDDSTTGIIASDWAKVLRGMLFATLLLIGLSIALARTITRPLQDLALAADLGMSAGPDKAAIQVRVHIPDLSQRPDEIGDVSRTMRGLVNALYDRVEAHERFAADVAHEIKNPLASLHAAAGGLRAARSEVHFNRLLDVIELDVRRLDRIVSDTANASRLDAELVMHDREEFDLVGLLDTLCEHLAQQARLKGVDFIKFLPEDPIRMTGLQERVAQVFVNLITNAISFCGSGDAVRVWVQERQGRALVVVEDTGPGIPDSALKGVFKRFYSQRPEDQFGTHSGLGLAIAKQIIEAHQGVIWAENIRVMDADADSPPLGTRLVVGLPL